MRCSIVSFVTFCKIATHKSTTIFKGSKATFIWGTLDAVDDDDCGGVEVEDNGFSVRTLFSDLSTLDDEEEAS